MNTFQRQWTNEIIVNIIRGAKWSSELSRGFCVLLLTFLRVRIQGETTSIENELEMHRGKNGSGGFIRRFSLSNLMDDVCWAVVDGDEITQSNFCNCHLDRRRRS